MVIHGTYEQKLFPMMLVSRIISFGLLNCQHRFILSYTRCFISNQSHTSSSSSESNDKLNSNDQKRSISTTKPIDNNNNEWLWTYLRDRKSFADLSEEQRRRVIEIG